MEGAAGVQTVLDHLLDEAVRAMRLCGAASLAELTPNLVKS
jgi:isopentenyl diphosphate isomerase/L-lactate dehydrogenase-like FMN-dependent dehydrogenase